MPKRLCVLCSNMLKDLNNLKNLVNTSEDLMLRLAERFVKFEPVVVTKEEVYEEEIAEEVEITEIEVEVEKTDDDTEIKYGIETEEIQFQQEEYLDEDFEMTETVEEYVLEVPQPPVMDQPVEMKLGIAATPNIAPMVIRPNKKDRRDWNAVDGYRLVKF